MISIPMTLASLTEPLAALTQSRTIGQLAEMLDASAGRAVAPLVTLTLGLLLLLLVETVRGLDKLRTWLFGGTLLATAWSQSLLLSEPAGLVLDGTYASTRTSAGWGLVFVASAAIAWAFGQRYYRTNRVFLGEHDLLMLASVAGMTLMAGSRDLIVFFVGLELLSVPLYCLVAFRRARNDSVEAGLKYFVLGAFSSALFLYGAALLYTATGTVELTALRELGLPDETRPLALTGVGLIVASLFFKASIVPFHLWVPDVYQGAPTPVTALMATGTKAAAFAFLIEIAFLLPGSSATLIGLFAVVTIALGNLGALVQDDLKRMLAYSGVAHAGTVLLVVAGSIAGDPEGGAATAALYYMAAYVFTAGGAFGLISWLEADGEHFTRLENIRGLAQRRPAIAAAMALFMLSLGGIPATGGFLGKWLVFSVTVRADMIAISVLGILFSVVALGYYLRVVVAMYMEPAPDGIAPPTTHRTSAGIAAAICAGMVLLLGVLPGIVLARLG